MRQPREQAGEPERIGRRRGGALLATLGMLLTAAAAAQTTTEPAPASARPAPPRIHKAANRMVKLLELESQRAAAARGLLELGTAAVPDLSRGLSDPRIEIVQIVAHILRHLGPDARAALPALVDMAKEKNAERARLARWAMAKIDGSGTTLIADFNGKKLIEFDAKGKKLHEIQVGPAWNATRLANGRYLVAVFGSKVIEVDANGKELRAIQVAKNAVDAERLADGNTLIADQAGNRVLEVDAKDKIVWEFKCGMPYDADRLPNGNTLIADYQKNRVVEVNRKGEIVWKHEAQGVLSADRLPGGNTLMALYGGRSVVEVDSAGKTVWSKKLDYNPDCALRLPNGHTLVGSQKGVREYNAKGEDVAVALPAGRATSIDRN